MSWPSPGDPYYTVEGGQRRTYYAVNTVPRLVMNGVAQNNPIGFTQAEFDESVNLYSFAWFCMQLFLNIPLLIMPVQTENLNFITS